MNEHELRAALKRSVPVPRKELDLANSAQTWVESVNKTFPDSYAIAGEYKVSRNLYDPNTLMRFFPRIKITNGVELDCIYYNDQHQGSLYHYARNIKEPRLSSYEEYALLAGVPRDLDYHDEHSYDLNSEFTFRAFVRHLTFEDSVEGYFQLACFYTLLSQLWLYNHALYREHHFFLSDTRVEIVDRLGLDGIAPSVLLGRPNEADVFFLAYGESAGHTIVRTRVLWPNYIASMEDVWPDPPEIYCLY